MEINNTKRFIELIETVHEAYKRGFIDGYQVNGNFIRFNDYVYYLDNASTGLTHINNIFEVNGAISTAVIEKLSVELVESRSK